MYLCSLSYLGCGILLWHVHSLMVSQTFPYTSFKSLYLCLPLSLSLPVPLSPSLPPLPHLPHLSLSPFSPPLSGCGVCVYVCICTSVGSVTGAPWLGCGGQRSPWVLTFDFAGERVSSHHCGASWSTSFWESSASTLNLTVGVLLSHVNTLFC